MDVGLTEENRLISFLKKRLHKNIFLKKWKFKKCGLFCSAIHRSQKQYRVEWGGQARCWPFQRQDMWKPPQLNFWLAWCCHHHLLLFPEYCNWYFLHLGRWWKIDVMEENQHGGEEVMITTFSLHSDPIRIWPLFMYKRGVYEKNGFLWVTTYLFFHSSYGRSPYLYKNPRIFRERTTERFRKP